MMPDMYIYKKEYFQFHHEVRTWMHPSKIVREMSISEYNHLYAMKFKQPSPIKESPQDLLYYMNTNHYSQTAKELFLDPKPSFLDKYEDSYTKYYLARIKIYRDLKEIAIEEYGIKDVSVAAYDYVIHELQQRLEEANTKFILDLYGWRQWRKRTRNELPGSSKCSISLSQMIDLKK
jgi:hypothetical protein